VTRLVVALLAAAVPALATAAPAPPVDPRTGGLTISMGEWAVVPEAPSIRPGRVTFVIANRGKVVHGFRIKEESERSGGDRFEARSISLRPGQKTRLTVELAPGTYSIECFVEGHDDLGMQRLFHIKKDAPLVAPKSNEGTTVRISGFAFTPATLRVKTGTTVTWKNSDPAPHAVRSTANSTLESKQLGRGATYSHRFDRAGAFPYVCAIHPQMKARVVVWAG
jgi:plastocyanin